MKSIILALCCLLLTGTGTNNVHDLQGRSHTVSNGDVSLFDGREVRNGTLVISEGEYLLQVTKEGGTCLMLGDNMELVIDGALQLAPNGFKSCDVIRVVGNNVRIHGSGSIVGDCKAHTGTEGEWGMGIRMDGSRNVTVSGLTIADCWGDCIYIGAGSRNIQITDCRLRGSRRQGVSIVKADSVTVAGCTIADISGTNPQYAIDIEPNKRCTVDNILISNVTVTGCEGGFRATLGKKTFGNARIGKVEIRNCRVEAKSRHTIHLAGCEHAVVEDCVIKTRKGEKPILSRKVGHLSEKNNKVIRERKQ